MKVLIALAMLAALGGCAQMSKTYTPDGREGATISCSGPYMAWSQCFQKAGEVCGAKGYDLLDRSGDNVSTAGGYGSYGVYGGGAGGFSQSAMSRTMLIACKT